VNRLKSPQQNDFTEIGTGIAGRGEGKGQLRDASVVLPLSYYARELAGVRPNPSPPNKLNDRANGQTMVAIARVVNIVAAIWPP